MKEPSKVKDFPVKAAEPAVPKPAVTSDPRSAKIHEVVVNKAMSRREKLDAITAMGLTAVVEADELIAYDDARVNVYTTMKNDVNFEGNPHVKGKAK